MINFKNALGVHEQALLVREKRSEILANNLANADTPGFHARDIDFQEVLNRSNAEASAARLTATDSMHFANLNNDFSDDVKYRLPSQAALDGNTVDDQIEKALFTQNSLEYLSSFNFLNSRFKGLVFALRGE